MRKSFLALCSSFALSSGLITDLHAEEVLFESLKITTPNGELSDGFGRTVAVENNRIVVGAPLAGPTNAGSAYVFNTQTGSLINTLEFGNPLTSRFFGNAVALATGVTLIGAPNSFDGGAASLFVNGRESVLLPFSSENGSPSISNFGYAVALSSNGSTMAIGARGDTGEPDAGSNGGGGAMYIYTPDGEVNKVFASDADFADNFGTAVATTSTFAVGSAPFDNDNGNDSGSVYVFDTATGLESYKVVPPDSQSGDLFGLGVAASGSAFAVSAPWHDEAGLDSGAVYVYDAIQGIQLNKFTVPGTSRFGIAIAMDDTHLVVSSIESTHVFELATGSMVAELRQSSPTPGLFFGRAVALHGDTVVVAAEDINAGGQDLGEVYVYSLSDGNSEPNDPPPTSEATTVSVQSIEAGVYTVRRRNGRIREGAEVTIVVADNLGEPVEGATVTVQLSGRLGERLRGITGVDGSVVMQSERTRRQRRRVINYTASVVDIDSSLGYDPDSNVESSDSSR